MPPKKRSASANKPIDVDGDEVVEVSAVANNKSPAKGANFLAEMAAQKAAKKGTLSEGAQVGQELHLSQYLSEPSWQAAIGPLFTKPYMSKVEGTLAAELANSKEIFPPLPLVFSAFNECPLSKLKVVLIGQDPYHDNNQAHGMCFSVMPGIKVPPSLANMYKELATDIPGFVPPPHGYLGSWAAQGVLMLNATLTVEAHKANSHASIGWQNFTDDVISFLSSNTSGLVFLLWGGFAQKKGSKIDRTKHRVIEVAHPSPLSVTKWVGCKTFSKCNTALEELGKAPVSWHLPAKADGPVL
jgi:uracil-DNA glycosylase